ncbi:MAG: 5'-3' exonuclease H3TH domain-containing protein [Verrucomicrobiota bacterium]
MAKRLYLLDGMALIYRAHFALIRSPIFTSRGFNTSAIFGFTNTLLEILEKRKPTHIAAVFDTSAPTERHEIFPEYKANRDEMPEELSEALPHVKRVVEAFNIPVITQDGYEADDIIGTLARQADAAGEFETFMVTPDKDFAQLVTETSKIHKPGRQGSDVEILGVEEILENWQIERPEQVIDILGLWGDSSDNIPGVPGVGEKTAKKLVAAYGSVEGLLENTDKLKGKQKENVINNAEQARLSKKLATIITDVPTNIGLDDLELKARNDEALQSLLVQFEFNAIGKRLYGKEFQAGRGHIKVLGKGDGVEDVIVPDLKTMDDVEATYEMVDTAESREQLAKELKQLKAFCFDTETSALDPKKSQLAGLAFCWESKHAYYVPVAARSDLEVFRDAFEDPLIEKVGHNLKFDLSVLLWNGVEARGAMFDTMLAHTLVAPEQKHTMDYISEALLGYSPVSITSLIGEKDQEGGQLSMLEAMERKPEEVAKFKQPGPSTMSSTLV